MNSFFNHKRRGSWFSNIHRRWYELDGFIMRQGQRHRYAKKLSTVGEATISDHKPKKLVVDIRTRKWRRVFGRRRRTPQIKWENLKIEEVQRRLLTAA